VASTAGEEGSHRNLLIRRPPTRVAAPGVPAHVAVAFDRGVPVAVNGVALALPELIDSLSLIAGQHGIGAAAPVHAPAAEVLQAAYAALESESGEVHLRLLDGGHTVVAVHDRIPQLVNHA
jgi:argininosuccinate synthase